VSGRNNLYDSFLNWMREQLITRSNSVYGRPLNPTIGRAMARYAAQRARNTLISGRTRLSRGRTRSYTRYKRRTKSGLGTLGGTNADSRLVYRKKRMPTRKKRRWKSFVKKINAVAERELGTRTVLFNDQLLLTSTAAGKQLCLSLALYSCNNSDANKTWLKDLDQIVKLENTANSTALNGETVDDTTKFMFHSGIMDITLRNVSGYHETLNGPIILDAAAQMEVDVYEIYVRKAVKTNSIDNKDLSQLFNSNDSKEIGGTGTGIEIQDRGATPWEVPHNFGLYGVKIYKKTKYFIPSGQTITHQSRDPKRHVASKKTITENDGFNMPGWTKHLFIIGKLVPGLTIGSGANEYAQRLALGLTRKYMYKVEGMNDSRERLITSTVTVGNPS